MSTPLAAIVLCAGKGTRMKSDSAKVLHRVLGRPLFAYPVERALRLGAKPLVAVVGHQAEAVRNAFGQAFPQETLQFALQAEQRGTGHAVQCALEVLGDFAGPVLILYGDVPLLREQTLLELRAAQERAGGKMALVSTELEDPHGYGRILRKGKGAARVVEEKDCTQAQRRLREVNAGIYVVDAKLLRAGVQSLTANNAQGELYLTDLVAFAAKKGAVGIVPAPAEETAGVNDRAELAAASQRLQARVNFEHLHNGVTLADPQTAWISDDVEIGPDAEIGPCVTLSSCRIGAGVKVGQGSIVVRSAVGDGVEVKPYCVIEDAVVGPQCIIGPYARLRPGTHLAAGVHLGNFVETKNARIGRGSKANHLSYLGDAEIGSGVNVGAGTITCNYDGVKKHTTRLGNDVFIGSDTQLVAPVSVGDGAYVGAGTTVTRDVPPRSLALSRAPQVIKEGWVDQKKKGA